MSRNLKKCIPILQSLVVVKDGKKRQGLLQLFEQNISRALRELCYNLIRGNMPLTDENKKSLLRFKRVIRLLADAKTNKTTVRRMVKQSGRGLPMLIPLLVSLAGSALL